jgi:uncharacterized Ntn-hydrolase superfamily protein
MYGKWGFGTFSIVASDPERKFWGVAVATKPRSVGATVPWAEWRIGAVATQANANYYYGPQALQLLRRGLSAEEVVRKLTRSDHQREQRQLGIVDRKGRSAAWTGSKCHEFALHQTGEGYSCQGNLLASATVVPAMARSFESTRGTLASRMVAAIKAGAREGGDSRGMDSAALFVAHREPWFPKTWSDYWVNIRVDLHRRPIAELERILRVDEKDTRQFLARRSAAKRRKKGKKA